MFKWIKMFINLKQMFYQLLRTESTWIFWKMNKFENFITQVWVMKV